MKPQRGKTPRKAQRKAEETDPVQVYARVRPNGEQEECVKVISPTTLQLTPPEGSNALRNGVFKETQYSFTTVFDKPSTQKEMFDNVAVELVSDVLKGKNALLFAYGVTSSGKTHTMTGSPTNQGILPRSLDVIFNSIGDLQAKKYVFKPDGMNGFNVQTEASAMLERQQRDILPNLVQTPQRAPPAPRMGRGDDGNGPRIPDPSKISDVEEDNNYAVFVSYVEIYNNYIYDLLSELQYDPITGYKAPQSSVLREDPNRNMYVSGVTEIEVKSTEEAYDILLKGQKRRKVAHTQLNTESSRSHSVFNIRVVQAPLDPMGQEVLQDKSRVAVSQLSLVDLAGSERTGRTNNHGDRLREAGNINQSLMVLRTCIEALRENQKSGANKMVPYRDSRLTHLFKNYFDGEGKVRMVVCVNPIAREYDETLHVMKFAEMTQEVQVARPSQVRFDVGLAPGRRKMNQRYHEVMERVAAGEDVEIPHVMLYDLGPAFPPLELRDSVDSDTLPKLAEYLNERSLRRQALCEDYDTKMASFRQSLVDMEAEMEELRGRAAEADKLERMLQQERTEKDKLQAKIRRLESERNDLAREDSLKRKLEEEAAARLRAKSHKLDMVKNIMSMDTDTEGDTPRRAARIYPARSDPDLSVRQAPPLSRPGYGTPYRAPPALNRPATRPRPRSPPPTKPVFTTGATPRRRAKSPPPVKPKPQVLPKYHRRSRSQDAWLDHKPLSTTNTDTVLQVKMTKKKSVSKLDKKDLTKANKYALTLQDIDSEGDINTKIVKGDVKQTVGGGKEVLFTDIEILKQKSPGDRKRRSPALKPEDFDGEWTDTGERCRIGIEGHSLTKRSKTGTVV